MGRSRWANAGGNMVLARAKRLASVMGCEGGGAAAVGVGVGVCGRDGEERCEWVSVRGLFEGPSAG